MTHISIEIDEPECLDDISNHDPGKFFQLWIIAKISHDTNVVPSSLYWLLVYGVEYPGGRLRL